MRKGGLGRGGSGVAGMFFRLVGELRGRQRWVSGKILKRAERFGGAVKCFRALGSEGLV